jgi:hypothetical protein
VTRAFKSPELHSGGFMVLKCSHCLIVFMGWKLKSQGLILGLRNLFLWMCLKKKLQPHTVAHACNACYLVDWGGRIVVQDQPRQKVLKTLSQKQTKNPGCGGAWLSDSNHGGKHKIGL